MTQAEYPTEAPQPASGEPASPDDPSALEEWPTHGGYLGCLMAIIFGCLLSGFLGSELISFVHYTTRGPAAIFITLAVLVMIAGIILFGRLGWWLGRRFYREYPASARGRRKARSPDDGAAAQS